MPIKIIAKKDGFRRAGLAHVGTVIYADDRFTKEQLKALEKEPNLDVSQTEAEPTVDNDGKPIAVKDKAEAKGDKK